MKYLLFTLLLMLMAGCHKKETVAEIMNRKFNARKIKLGILVKALQDNPKFDSVRHQKESPVLNAVELPVDLTKQFNELDIDWVAVQRGTLRKYAPNIFIFKTNWIVGDSVNLVFNPFDSVETINGFYRKDVNQNEVWGLGNNWQAWKIIKYLEMKQ
jgi:hypothetical protein